MPIVACDQRDKSDVLPRPKETRKEEELTWSRFAEGLHGFEFGHDVLTNQSFDFDQTSGKVPAKTAYIIKLHH